MLTNTDGSDEYKVIYSFKEGSYFEVDTKEKVVIVNNRNDEDLERFILINYGGKLDRKKVFN